MKTSPADLQRQFDLSQALGRALARAGEARPGATTASAERVARLRAELAQLYEQVQSADAAPTTQLAGAIREGLAALDAALAAGGEVR